MKFYAGIGPRKTPDRVLSQMTNAATQLGIAGWTLRSGGATGADTAFDQGSLLKDIHLPWNGYNGLHSGMNGYKVPIFHDETKRIAEQYHGQWNALTPTTELFMFRNVTILMGEELNEHVKMVLTWFRGSHPIGGTAHGLKIAHAYGIPIFNIANYEDQQAAAEFVENCK